MAQIELEIRGLDEVYRRFGTMQAQEIMEPPMRRAVMYIQERMAKYPPQRSTPYRRTGTLGRSWTTKVTREGDGVTGRVGTNVIYAPFVQSSQFQAWMHRGRWQTDEQVLREALPKITADFEATVTAALG